jgi:RimJ/RimL family protein N-acetyltransferase
MDIGLGCIGPEDLPTVAKLANNHAIAAMTNNLPHPYTEDHAKQWFEYVESHDFEHVFKITVRGKMAGVVGLVYEEDHNRAELGYWLGEKYWNRGIMSEAVSMALAYAFGVLDVRRVFSRCYAVNTASKRVLEKNGFECEGCLKQHHECMGVVHDVLVYGLLKEQYDSIHGN